LWVLTSCWGRGDGLRGDGGRHPFAWLPMHTCPIPALQELIIDQKKLKDQEEEAAMQRQQQQQAAAGRSEAAAAAGPDPAGCRPALDASTDWEPLQRQQQGGASTSCEQQQDAPSDPLSGKLSKASFAGPAMWAGSACTHPPTHCALRADARAHVAREWHASH